MALNKENSMDFRNMELECAELTATGSISAPSIFVDGDELDVTDVAVLAGVVAGTAEAGKAVVLGTGKTLDEMDIGALSLTGTALGATAAELNSRADDSAMIETRTGAGAISPTIAETMLVTTDAAQALTLAVPTKPGFIKVITHKTDGGSGVLASTNILGQSSGTTSITFTDAGDCLVLVANVDLGKWLVLKELGVTAA